MKMPTADQPDATAQHPEWLGEELQAFMEKYHA